MSSAVPTEPRLATTALATSEALQDSSASLVLFLEYIPHNLHSWLTAQIEAGGEVAENACQMVERELTTAVSFMNEHGLLHFDTHFENILTDGRRLFFADYGLAISSTFELDEDEIRFFIEHQSYDRAYSATCFVNWLLVALYGYSSDDRRSFIQSWVTSTGSSKEKAAKFRSRTKNFAESGKTGS